MELTLYQIDAFAQRLFEGTLVSHERPSIGFWVTGVIGCAMVLAYTASSGLDGFAVGDPSRQRLRVDRRLAGG